MHDFDFQGDASCACKEPDNGADGKPNDGESSKPDDGPDDGGDDGSYDRVDDGADDKPDGAGIQSSGHQLLCLVLWLLICSTR